MFLVIIPVATAPIKLNGTILSAIFSALLWTPALRFSEFSISPTICCILLSCGKAVTFISIQPSAATVPAYTLTPVFLCTGNDSPVMEASFTMASPKTTTPSTGIRDPVLILITSSFLISDMGTDISFPSETTQTESTLTESD